jgi:hypothetical protein
MNSPPCRSDSRSVTRYYELRENNCDSCWQECFVCDPPHTARPSAAWSFAAQRRTKQRTKTLSLQQRGFFAGLCWQFFLAACPGTAFLALVANTSYGEVAHPSHRIDSAAAGPGELVSINGRWCCILSQLLSSARVPAGSALAPRPCRVLAMAGLAATTSFCNKNNVNETLASCSSEYQQDWCDADSVLCCPTVLLQRCCVELLLTRWQAVSKHSPGLHKSLGWDDSHHHSVLVCPAKPD